MKLTCKIENEIYLKFSDTNVHRSNNSFETSIQRKSALCGVYTNYIYFIVSECYIEVLQ